jgi:2-methylcitrate dehydratase PrpD
MYGQTGTEQAPSMTSGLWTLTSRPVDERTRRRAVLHWLDWIGCVAAAARAPITDVLRRTQPTSPSASTVTSLLGPARDAWHATLLDAAPGNVEEMDDMHRQAILHPGPVVMPALAGLARDGLATARVLDAVVRGYEVMIRIGRALGPRHYHHCHNTATAGAFGSAAACADALGLSAEQAVWALGNAGTQAAGLWQVRLEPVMSKQLHTAHAAWAGRSAATLASHGFTGPARILEGERGFFAAMCSDGNPGAVLSPEPDWLIHETSFKPWPACRHTHPTIDAVLALREAHGGPVAFAEAEVESFRDAIAICDQPRPRTRVEAKFSLQYCVAAAAAFGPLRPEHFDETCVARSELQAAAARVRLRVAPDLDAAYPRHYGARVALRLPDGRWLRHTMTDALGDPERPLDEAAVVDKARRLMDDGGVAPARRDAVLRAAEALLAAQPQTWARPFPAALLDPLF